MLRNNKMNITRKNVNRNIKYFSTPKSELSEDDDQGFNSEKK